MDVTIVECLWYIGVIFKYLSVSFCFYPQVVSPFSVSQSCISAPPSAPVQPRGWGSGGGERLPGGRRKVETTEYVSVSEGLNSVAQQTDQFPQHAHQPRPAGEKHTLRPTRETLALSRWLLTLPEHFPGASVSVRSHDLLFAPGLLYLPWICCWNQSEIYEGRKY